MSFWTKLLGFERSEKKKMSRLRDMQGTRSVVSPTPPEKLDLDISLQTDVGLVRTNNEDRGVYRRPAEPETASAKGTLVLVADGMGGAAAGEIASETAIETIPDLYYGSKKAPALALKEALEQASRKIHKLAVDNPELHGMGTTCVALAIVIPEVYVAYVGDSRLYLLRDGRMYQLTEDHTVVNEMMHQGLLTRDQARHHEERNVLSVSIGGRPEIAAAYWEKPMIIRAGDRFLACSDGLHDLLSESEMQAIILAAPPHEAVPNLIEAAKHKGGHDNITAAVIHVRTAEELIETCERSTREVSISLQ